MADFPTPVARLLTSLSNDVWLAPTTQVSRLSGRAHDQILEELRAFHEALAPLASQGRPLDPLHVEFCFDWEEAQSTWRQAWRESPLFDGELEHRSSEVLRALSRAAELGRRGASEALDASRRADLDEDLDGVLQQVASRSLPWCESPGVAPGQVLASRHAEWLLGCPDLPSPWLPLLALWKVGLWPMVLPAGRVLVYVPRDPPPNPFPHCPPLPLVSGGPAPLEYLGTGASMLPASFPLAQLVEGETERHPLAVHTPIGRSHDNVVVLKERTVSRHQAWLVYRRGRFELVDQGSSGGTWLDRQRIDRPTTLEAGVAFSVPTQGPPVTLKFQLLGGLRRGSFGLVHRT